MPVVWEAIAASALPNLGGLLNGYLIRPEINRWYKNLKKPSWTPPNGAFPIVWTSLYAGMGYASYLVWKDGGGFDGEARLPLALYAGQLALNWTWSPIFFHYHSLKWSMVNIVFLWSSAAACGVTFWQINKVAGAIMIPYLAWLGLAAALNYRILKDNPEEESNKTE